MACKLTACGRFPSSESVLFYRNHKIPESERLTYALLFSLVLHLLLLFFVRISQPAWNSLISQNAPLNVELQQAPAASIKPSAMPEASRAGVATARVGVQNDNRFQKKAINAATSVPVEQPRMEIPKALINEEIMTINKPARTTVAKNAPELLVSETPPPENKEAPFAPAPSVSKPDMQAAPPVEKLASVEAVPGAKQENIVFADAALKAAEVAKPGSSTVLPQPAKTEEPVPAEPPPPIRVDEPKPVEIKPVEPVKVEEPAPVKIETPKPVEMPKPEPAKISEPVPPRTAEPQPAQAKETQAAPRIAEAGSKNSPAENGKSDVFHDQSPVASLPGLLNLNLSALRHPPNDDGHKIKFGQPRKKTIGLREQDFRYAMYADAVRLKLERIGKYNYPIEAARKNLSGTLSIVISIRADGSLEDFSIIQPSYEVLNAGAEKIVRMADPFPPLPANIRQDTDVLSIRINWSFSVASQSLD